ncbi:hypothetical protein DLAC_08757 [Tieghemostelium lacteum]|uniref:Ubiquitin-like domain-containing protein n=1 Tax=Tieghemostelium lacteum TaxID=361077 RepID=A0A151Z869_TIELA|nr:hypothetical protein DLAC_08757 [Tieghemostelium lacteum]|eukprot:KYQ90166.1 hypothetical protein DLAC_08757 [Tieghemostelium lacteum]
MSNNRISIRFIVDRNHQFVDSFTIDDTKFRDVEQRLREKKPKDLFTTEQINKLDELKLTFIYSGKIFNDNSAISEIMSMQTKQPYNLKVLIQNNGGGIELDKNIHFNSSAFQQAQQYPIPSGQAINDNNTDTGNDTGTDDLMHMHGCIFDVTEFQQIENIFIHKQDQITKKVSISFLNGFLHSYWSYYNQTMQPQQPQPFPVEKLSKILKEVLHLHNIDVHSKINREEFRIIFFLFSNDSSDQQCPNGSKETVKRTIEQYHTSLTTIVLNEQQQPPPLQTPQDIPFTEERFEKIYQLVKRDQPPEYQLLSCRNIELLFYLYSADILLQINGNGINNSSSSSSNNNNNNNNVNS